MKANKSKNFISNLLHRIDKDWSTSHNHSLIMKGIIALSDKIDELSHLPEKLTLLHNKIDSIYSLLETLSDRLNKLEYNGEVEYGELYHVGKSKKQITVSLRREEKELSAPNPHGDDDFATPT